MEALGRGGETFWRMGEHLPHFSSPLTPFPSKTFVFIESLFRVFNMLKDEALFFFLFQ